MPRRMETDFTAATSPPIQNEFHWDTGERFGGFLGRHALSALAMLLISVLVSPSEAQESGMYAELTSYLVAREAELEAIPSSRKEALDELAAYIRKARSEQDVVRLLFVCTHNSRRSHLAQLWALAAAAHYGFTPLEAFSAGTDVTAFNPRAVAALERAGWHAGIVDEGENATYQMRWGEDSPGVRCFSKVISDAANPSRDFAAVMVCSEADQHCPTVPGARFRIAIPYEDPKASDGMPDEAAVYDARCQQIAREMLYVFSRLRDFAN